MKYNDINYYQNVIDSASELILSKGVNGWNMDQLSKKAGIAKNTLYRIVSSKEEVIEKVIIKFINYNRTQLKNIIDSESDYFTALEKITYVFPKILNTLYTNVMNDIFREYPSIEKSVIEHRDEFTESIINFFQKGIDNGALKQDIDAKELFEMLQMIVTGYLKQGYKSETMEKKMANALIYLVNGIKN